jgi:hypothetical protein
MNFFKTPCNASFVSLSLQELLYVFVPRTCKAVIVFKKQLRDMHPMLALRKRAQYLGIL